MILWSKEFFPQAGEKHSPVDFLNNITSASEKAQIAFRLELISERETWEWPPWVKMVQKIYQLTAGDYRVYFNLDDRKVIICHICRKVGQKALQGDIDRAKSNFESYLESKSEKNEDKTRSTI